MTNQPYDPLKELEAALAVEPSPAFAARVRERIGEEAGREPGIVWWRLAALAATMAVIAVAGAQVWRVARTETQPGTPFTSVVTTGVGTQLIVVPAAVPQPQPQPGRAVAPKPVRQIPQVAVSAAAPPSAVPAFEVIVSPADGIALRRLLLALQEGSGYVPPAVSLVDEKTGEMKPLDDLTAIEVPPLVLGTLTTAAGGGGKGREER